MRVISDEKTIYKYSELSNEAKQKVVDNLVEWDFFSFPKNDISLAEQELINIGQELLDHSAFKHATITDVWCDFSYSQGSGAVLSFEYDTDDNFFLDFDINEKILEKFNSEDHWIQDYNLTNEEIQDIKDILHRDLSQEVEILFKVTQTSRYANYDIDWEIYCSANQDIRYCIQDIVEEWIYDNLVKDKRLVDDLESSFSNDGYKWYESICDINNYDDESFQDQYFYEDGKFAYWEDDLE